MTEYQQLDNLIKEFATVFPGSMSTSLAIAKAKSELKRQQAVQNTAKRAHRRQPKQQIEDWELFLLELERGEQPVAQQ